MCNNGLVKEQSKATKAYGILIDFKVVSKKIKYVVEFVGKVEGVHAYCKGGLAE